MLHPPNQHHLTLSQCLDNLRNAGLLVLQDERVSDDAKSFLGELVQTILDRVGPSDSTQAHFRLKMGTSRASHLRIAGQRPTGTPTSPYRFEVDSVTGAILISHLSTGKTLTCPAEELINLAKD